MAINSPWLASSGCLWSFILGLPTAAAVWRRTTLGGLCADAAEPRRYRHVIHTDNGTKLGLAGLRENSPFSTADQDYYELFLKRTQRRQKKLDHRDTRGKENTLIFQNIQIKDCPTESDDHCLCICNNIQIKIN